MRLRFRRTSVIPRTAKILGIGVEGRKGDVSPVFKETTVTSPLKPMPGVEVPIQLKRGGTECGHKMNGINSNDMHTCGIRVEKEVKGHHIPNIERRVQRFGKRAKQTIDNL
jgi:hypothetical protein